MGSRPCSTTAQSCATPAHTPIRQRGSAQSCVGAPQASTGHADREHGECGGRRPSTLLGTCRPSLECCVRTHRCENTHRPVLPQLTPPHLRACALGRSGCGSSCAHPSRRRGSQRQSSCGATASAPPTPGRSSRTWCGQPCRGSQRRSAARSTRSRRGSSPGHPSGKPRCCTPGRTRRRRSTAHEGGRVQLTGVPRGRAGPVRCGRTGPRCWDRCTGSCPPTAADADPSASPPQQCRPRILRLLELATAASVI